MSSAARMHGASSSRISLPRALLALALFGSGFASLVFEALWFRQARLAFGSTVWASALVTGSFMAGLGVGALLGFRNPPSRRNALLGYAAVEVAIASAGVVLVHVLPALARSFAIFAVEHEGEPWLVRGFRFACAFALLALPSTAMGLTLPLALHGSGAGRNQAATLYGVNTLGATVGVLATELALLPRAGVRGAAWIAAGLSAFAALMALAAAFAEEAAPLSPAAREPQGGARARVYLAAMALTGFAMLAFETVWLRLLLLWVADTPLAFAAVLALVLAAVALGSFTSGAVLRRTRGVLRADLLAYAAGMSGALGLSLFPFVLSRVFSLEPRVGEIALMAAPLIVPAAWCSGALFPVLVAEARDLLGGEARTAAALTAANALAGGLGAVVSAVWLLPELGMERAYLLLSGLFGLSGVLLTLARTERAQSSRFALAAYLASFALFPRGAIEQTYVRGSVSRWLGDDDRVVSVREALNATIVHVRHRRVGIDTFDQLASNSYSMATNDFAARRYMKLFAYLPRALHPRLERALIVGFGLGNTAEALVSEPALKALEIVDTSPETLALRREGALLSATDPLADPRVHVHLEDGRHYLEGSFAAYDLITGEPPPPLLAGVEELYSREYFELVRARLRDGGFATYWLPIINLSAAGACAVVNAFCNAFADCTLWHGAGPNFMLMGSRNAQGRVDLARFVAPFGDAAERRELEAIGLEHPVQLGALFIGDAPYLRAECSEHAELRDDFPRRLQAEAPRRERDQLLSKLRDTAAARARYLASAFVADHFPERARRDGAAQFESQRLLDDLLWDNPNARSLEVLDQVVRATPWKLPVLLLLDSDSDSARALGRLAPGHDSVALRRHRLAAALAERDLPTALTLARSLPAQQQPIPGLDAYLERLASGAELTRSR